MFYMPDWIYLGTLVGTDQVFGKGFGLSLLEEQSGVMLSTDLMTFI